MLPGSDHHGVELMCSIRSIFSANGVVVVDGLTGPKGQSRKRRVRKRRSRKMAISRVGSVAESQSEIVSGVVQETRCLPINFRNLEKLN